MKCFGCGMEGHLIRTCPQRQNAGTHNGMGSSRPEGPDMDPDADDRRSVQPPDPPSCTSEISTDSSVSIKSDKSNDRFMNFPVKKRDEVIHETNVGSGMEILLKHQPSGTSAGWHTRLVLQREKQLQLREQQLWEREQQLQLLEQQLREREQQLREQQLREREQQQQLREWEQQLREREQQQQLREQDDLHRIRATAAGVEVAAAVAGLTLHVLQLQLQQQQQLQRQQQQKQQKQRKPLSQLLRLLKL